MGNDSKFPVSS